MPMVPDNGPYPWEQNDLAHRETEYLVFEEIAYISKTRRWRVLSKRSGDTLGRIRWHGPWRQFAFFPEPGCLFNSGCLTDISTFMADAMRDWRESRKRNAAARST